MARSAIPQVEAALTVTVVWDPKKKGWVVISRAGNSLYHSTPTSSRVSMDAFVARTIRDAVSRALEGLLPL